MLADNMIQSKQQCTFLLLYILTLAEFHILCFVFFYDSYDVI
jgi:hypothetical protein